MGTLVQLVFCIVQNKIVRNVNSLAVIPRKAKFQNCMCLLSNGKQNSRMKSRRRWKSEKNFWFTKYIRIFIILWCYQTLLRELVHEKRQTRQHAACWKPMISGFLRSGHFYSKIVRSWLLNFVFLFKRILRSWFGFSDFQTFTFWTFFFPLNNWLLR